MSEHADTSPAHPLLDHVVVDEVAAVPVTAGITRRALPSGQVAARVFDMEPGIQWPVVDHHDQDEFIYVVAGELIEGAERFGAGSYLHYGPGSSHQPRTESGVRILVWGAASQ